jgi:amino acid adenylation domain-containing protein
MSAPAGHLDRRPKLPTEGKPNFSGAKLRLLEQRMRGVGPQSERGIHPRDPGAKIPLSAEQRRVWLHALQQPDLPVYNEPVTICKYGSFDLHILEASFNEILRRHEVWRTSFSAEGDQLVHADVRFSLPLIDISGVPQAKREAEALRIATEDARAPISIQAFPLFRARVVRIRETEHRLCLTFHHIIFDGVSIQHIFVPELSAIYTSLEAGRPLCPPAPAVQYADYAIWREAHVESRTVKQHFAWWIDQLSGELPTLHLPEDRARPALTDYSGSMECFRIPASLAASLRQLSHRQGVTLYMTLLAAFNALLFRYSGQNDFIVGSATDARRRPELENVMGYFIDTFVLRTRPTADLTFSQYLSQIRESVLGGLEAADVPFDQVVKVINPRRDPVRHPIFQVFFTMRPRKPHLAEGWGIAQTDVTVGTSKFDLHLEVGDVPGAMDARFFYRTDIWDSPTIRRMATHWLVMLESVAQTPDVTLGSLGILAPDEVALLLEPGGWNDTARPFPQRTLKALFEEQVNRTPNSVAAAFGQERWTYQKLNLRADVLASSLRNAGVIHGSVVALVLDRSLDMLASLIAVQKVGAAYLPIDIQLPPAGIEALLRDANPSAVLTQRSLAHLVPSSGAPCLVVDKNAERRDVAAPVQNTLAGDLEDTAYLIYTSGTTGVPKPVEISQRSLVNLLVSMQASPGFSPKDVLLAVTSISFDIAALELFLPLISGGRVVIASRGEAQDPYLLTRAIRRSHCTVMQATPATWRTLLLSGWNDATVSSKDQGSGRLRVLCGGEPLSDDLADRLLATGAELWNMYGPTETTIWSLIHRVERPACRQKTPISVGRPVANTTAFIMDSNGQLLPVGIPGALFLGGVGLAKGYRGQAQQTDEQFMNVDSVGGLRLYNTGDIAVRRADGTIDILGRMDNRVKIRGYRVELEAVEAAILRHPRVAAAAVRAWPEPTGDLRLSAYIVPSDPGAPPALADIRSFLKIDLPESMVPSDVIPLSSIPLTSHGKVDRARLPPPTAPDLSSVLLRFRSPAEERLAAIWVDLLGQAVGPEQNFFDLGGHSVLMAALQKRIHKDFGHLIPLAKLFHLPTVRQQAELIDESAWHNPTLPPGVLPLQPQGGRRTVFWVHYMNTQLAMEFGEDQPFVFVTLTPDDVRSLGQNPTLEEIAGCHVRKILATRIRGPYIIGGLCVGSILAYEIATQLKAKRHEVSLLVMLDAPNPSSFARSSLADKFKELRYYINRSKRLGLRETCLYLGERVKRRLTPIIGHSGCKTELRIAQELIETATLAYNPRIYDGKVLLLLASQHSPQNNFVPGWQLVVPHDLCVQVVDTHHRDLMKGETVRNVANAIAYHLSA